MEMNLQRHEDAGFEPPYEDNPHGEEQDIVDRSEGGRDNTDWTEVLMRRDRLGLSDEEL
jgi:hypothetical protein